MGNAKNLFMDRIRPKKIICFGPFMGELGWELFRWAGFIRKFKKNNPDKKILCSTRKGREDIYYGSVDGIHSFTIKNDYISARANMYRCDFLDPSEHRRIINEAKNRFRKAFFVDPPKCTVGKNFFSPHEMDFDFSPRKDNLKIIKNILSKNAGKMPICISPRHRTDSKKLTRNWPEQYWMDLFTRIRLTGKYLVFIIGSSASMAIPPKDESFVVLDNIRADNISNIGLTIEAIKNSVLTVGQQSALPILSNYLKTKTIMWGHEQVRHQVNENPMNTRCIFFEEPTVQYNTNPKIIFEHILKETGCL